MIVKVNFSHLQKKQELFSLRYNLLFSLIVLKNGCIMNMLIKSLVLEIIPNLDQVNQYEKKRY